MKLTKSLFVEYTSSPKLARRHLHDKATYQTIQEAKYGAIDGLTIGQLVEDMVLGCYPHSEITTIDTTNMWSNRHATYHQRTMQALQDSPELVYQPSFLHDDLFVKCDLLVHNDQGSYDLVEVKAKNRIRKPTKAAPLLDELIADLSFQRYVLSRTLGDRFSGRSLLAHLDSDYIRQGTVDPQELVVTEDVTDELRDDAQIEEIVREIRETLPLDQQAFDERFPYDGTDYLTYFGTPPPSGSLRSISYCHATKKRALYEQGKTQIAELQSDDIALLTKRTGEPSRASRCVELWQSGEEQVDTEAIEQALDSLTYPLYFYDYETVSRPVPLFDGTMPRQQVVVQYSCHQVERDGQITHSEGILEPGATDNEALLAQMIDQMNGIEQGSRIVRNQGFENKRNEERAARYPDFADPLLRLNEQTFDLMEVFSQQRYFHRAFEGSASIKNVLPVLTDISYDDLAVSNGALASDLLRKLITGELPDDQVDATIEQLLAYCKQDTWAMVAIRQHLLEKIKHG